MQNFQSLMAEHDLLDMLCLEFIQVVAQSADAAEIVNARARLSVVLEDHHSREDCFLYARLLTRRAPGLSTAVLGFNLNFAELAADWADYLQRWDQDAIAADRDGFADDTMVIASRLRARLAEENRLLR